MNWQAIEALATVGAAVGTVAVAIFAIWGDRYRHILAAPQLSVKLHHERGEIFLRRNGVKALYFHLKLENRRHWSPANDVRVLIERAAQLDNATGLFVLDALVYPLPLAWTPSEMGDFRRTVFDEEMCDLGYLNSDEDAFRFATIVSPSNFHNHVKKGEVLRLRIVATGQNTISRPLFLEIYWDGKWADDKEEMRKHLVVQEVSSLSQHS